MKEEIRKLEDAAQAVETAIKAEMRSVLMSIPKDVAKMTVKEYIKQYLAEAEATDQNQSAVRNDFQRVWYYSAWLCKYIEYCFFNEMIYILSRTKLSASLHFVYDSFNYLAVAQTRKIPFNGKKLKCLLQK